MSDIHSAVGSYAADALTPLERAEFEMHLAGCNSCRLEVAEFTETLAGLTPLVATRPPAALRDSVLAAIRTVQPLAPEVPVRAEEQRVRRVADPESTELHPLAPAAITELRPPLGPDEVAPLDEHPSEVPDWTWLGVTANLSDDLAARRGRRTDRILAVLVAAALIVALAFSGWVYVSWQENQTRVSEAQHVNNLLTASDVKIYSANVDGTPVSYTVSKQRNEALFIAQNLPSPGDNQVWELWTLKGDAATRSELVRTGGNVRQWIRGPVGDSDGLAISREPGPSGSPAPTPPILAKVSLKS
jgi:Anti-sigma-K factor rskA/Putative zinc-finger